MSSLLDVPLYQVVVLDSEKTSFKQAFDAVYHVFSLSTERANAVVHEINDNGFSSIGTFTHEVAETYVDEMQRYTEAFKFELQAEINYEDFDFELTVDEADSSGDDEKPEEE